MSNVPQFDPNPAPRKGWFGRNWLWFVPVVLLSTGCFCCLGCGGIFFGVFQALKSSEPYQMALAHVQNDPEVIGVLGEPIVEAGFVPFGAVEVENDHGTSTLHFQVSGPNGQAWVSSTAVREGGRWQLTFVEVTPDDGSTGPIVWPADAAIEGPNVEIDFDIKALPNEDQSNSGEAAENDVPEGTESSEPAGSEPSEGSSEPSDSNADDSASGTP